jgi:selenide,water dikinase
MKIDLAKRRRVMERSQALGHCICDPRQPCPCAVFRDDGICPCAGERPEPVDLSRVKLTELVHNAGCASKIAPADLEAVLTRLPEVKDPAVISGLAASDDAAIYRISDGLHLVQTVDVFTPCVDDPTLFGKICAANCLSDVYAMGGTPLTALSILGFPSETLDGEIMYRMLAGAMEVFAEAGVALIGGHSIKDSEIKLGFSITGTIDPAIAAALDKPQIGDLLVLTKPLGTGVLTFCHQVGHTHAEGMAAAVDSMAALNRAAAEAMKAAGATACTDITGFGLFGHLSRMLRPARLSAQIFADHLPALPGAREAFQQDIIPGAVERNREYVGGDLTVEPGVNEASVHLGFDAQTSGGLLIAIAENNLPRLMSELADRKVQGHVIGKILPAGEARIVITKGHFQPNAAVSHSSQMNPSKTNSIPLTSTNATPKAACCCPGDSESLPVHSNADDTAKAFSSMIRSAQAPGMLDEKTKELILFSLMVLSRCHPCFDAHYRKAREMGLTQAELDEAAWCAIAMGGAPVRMFYQECLKRATGSSPSAWASVV